MNAFSTIEPDLSALRRPMRLAPIHQASLHDEPGEVQIDLHALWAALVRNRLFIAALVGAALLCGVASILLTTPTYRAEASVQVDAQSAKVLSTDDLQPIVAGSETERFIRTQMDIARSRSLAEEVARSLKLFDDPRFAEARLASRASAAQNKREVVDTLLKRVAVEMLPNSRIVRISYDNSNPELAARIANSFADQLITGNLQRRFSTSAYSRQFLGGQLGEAKRRLEDSERAMIAYARGAHLIDASAGATRTQDAGTKSLTTANLVQLNDAYSAARAARIQAQQRWEQARSAPAMSLPEVLANPAVQGLSERRADLKAQYRAQREHRKPDHPEVVQLTEKIAETNGQIDALAAGIRASIQGQFATAERQEQALAADVAALKEATLGEQDRSVQYNILKREVDTSREMYDALLQRFKEISAAAGIANNNIAIIDRAEAPERPVSPNPFINIGVALLAGMSMALLAVFGRERFMDRIRDPEDIERKLKLPMLGVVPMLRRRARPQDALADQRSSFSEAHNSICTSLSFASARGVPPSIMLTSSRPAEGKSTTAMALAVSLAREGRRVVLIDADLRRPSLHTMLNAPNRVGLVHLLTGNKTLDEVVQPTELDDLFFIASGPLPPSPSGLLSGPMLSTLLDELGRAFDVALFDAPPVLGLADAPRLSSLVDASVFVLEANGAQTRMVERALRRLGDSRARIAGSVLTKYTSAESYYEMDYALNPGQRGSSPGDRPPLVHLDADSEQG